MEKWGVRGVWGCLGVMVAGFGIIIFMFYGSNSRIDNVYDRVDSLNDEITDEVSSSKDYLSVRIDGVLAEVSKVNSRIDDLYAEVSKVNSRIDDLYKVLVK